jgi:hypothetical protein
MDHILIISDVFWEFMEVVSHGVYDVIHVHPLFKLINEALIRCPSSRFGIKWADVLSVDMFKYVFQNKLLPNGVLFTSREFIFDSIIDMCMQLLELYESLLNVFPQVHARYTILHSVSTQIEKLCMQKDLIDSMNTMSF